MVTLRGLVYLLLVLVVNALEGEQRESLDLEGMLQKPLDDWDTFFVQKEVVPDPDVLRGTGVVWEGPPIFGPRSTRRSIPFPLARPSPSNIQNICQHGNRRPRYPKETLPANGFGYLYRKAMAVNHLESLFSVCCSNFTEEEDLRLCCSQQAWTKSLSDYCDDEFSVKTSHYHCCKKEDQEKWDCFEKEAPDPSYQFLGQVLGDNFTVMSQDFVFNPAPCQNKSLDDSAFIALRGTPTETANIGFPPGRPNSANIGPICANHTQRPRYHSKCLPQKGYKWLVRQLKAVNSLEKGFSQCCREEKAQQACAELKWKMMVDKFCKYKKNAKVKPFHCCEKGNREEQYECFATAAPNPDYFHKFSLAHPSLDMVCDTYPALQRMKNVPLPLDKLADRCCMLVGEKRTTCIRLEVPSLNREMCNAKKRRSGQSKPKCCTVFSKNEDECIQELMRSITKAQHNNNRKLCPVFS